MIRINGEMKCACEQLVGPHLTEFNAFGERRPRFDVYPDALCVSFGLASVPHSHLLHQNQFARRIPLALFHVDKIDTRSNASAVAVPSIPTDHLPTRRIGS